MIKSARTMFSHHHGDEYEDLYFIDSVTNTVKSMTNYREKTLTVDLHFNGTNYIGIEKDGIIEEIYKKDIKR